MFCTTGTIEWTSKLKGVSVVVAGLPQVNRQAAATEQSQHHGVSRVLIAAQCVATRICNLYFVLVHKRHQDQAFIFADSLQCSSVVAFCDSGLPLFTTIFNVLQSFSVLQSASHVQAVPVQTSSWSSISAHLQHPCGISPAHQSAACCSSYDDARPSATAGLLRVMSQPFWPPSRASSCRRQPLQARVSAST